VTAGYDERCNARSAGLLSQEKAAPLSQKKEAPLKQFFTAARALRDITQTLTSRTSANCRPGGKAWSLHRRGV
jgi:hypothetical protein